MCSSLFEYNHRFFFFKYVRTLLVADNRIRIQRQREAKKKFFSSILLLKNLFAVYQLTIVINNYLLLLYCCCFIVKYDLADWQCEWNFTKSHKNYYQLVFFFLGITLLQRIFVIVIKNYWYFLISLTLSLSLSLFPSINLKSIAFPLKPMFS